MEGYYPNTSNVLRMLGYFSLVGLVRVHALVGDYHAGLKGERGGVRGGMGWGEHRGGVGWGAPCARVGLIMPGAWDAPEQDSGRVWPGSAAAVS